MSLVTYLILPPVNGSESTYSTLTGTWPLNRSRSFTTTASTCSCAVGDGPWTMRRMIEKSAFWCSWKRRTASGTPAKMPKSPAPMVVPSGNRIRSTVRPSGWSINGSVTPHGHGSSRSDEMSPRR